MSLKSLIITYMPALLLNALKRIHYLRMLKGFTEAEEQDLIVAKQLVRSGDYAVDIGANVGCYTKVLSEVVGPQGLIVSLEPVPETFKILDHCVKKLSLTNVQTLNCAASDKNGTMSMLVPRYEAGGYNYYQARLVVRGESRSASQKDVARQEYSNIPVRTLDEVLKDMIHPVTFIKCDVEGHELAVLLGSRKIIDRWMPAWLIEVSGDPDARDSSAATLFELLHKVGYEAWWYTEGRLKRRVLGDISVNYFFLRSEHLERVRSMIAS